MDKKFIKNNIFDYLHTKNLGKLFRERKSTDKKFIKNKIFDPLLSKNLGNYSETGRVQIKNL